MLEHPEIGWMERTGYPSWLQERDRPMPRPRKAEDPGEAYPMPFGIALLASRRKGGDLWKKI